MWCTMRAYMAVVYPTIYRARLTATAVLQCFDNDRYERSIYL